MAEKIHQVCKQIREAPFAFLQNAPVEVEVYFNRFVVHYQNEFNQKTTLEHTATPDVSNSRMIIADFEKALLNVKDVFKQIPHKWYLGKPVVLVNVKEHLADGLTPIESRVLSELFATVATKAIVFYHDERFVGQVLDEREIKNAKKSP